MSMTVFFEVYKKKLTINEVSKLDYKENCKLSIYSEGAKGQWWITNAMKYIPFEDKYFPDGEISGIGILDKDLLKKFDTYCDSILENGYDGYLEECDFHLWKEDLVSEEVKNKAIQERVNYFKKLIKELLDNYNEDYTYTIEFDT